MNDLKVFVVDFGWAGSPRTQALHLLCDGVFGHGGVVQFVDAA